MWVSHSSLLASHSEQSFISRQGRGLADSRVEGGGLAGLMLMNQTGYFIVFPSQKC